MKKDELIYAIKMYGFVNPKNKKITASEFKENILKTYDPENPVTAWALIGLDNFNHATFLFRYDGTVEVTA